jgi:hypothetical protein
MEHILKIILQWIFNIMLCDKVPVILTFSPMKPEFHSNTQKSILTSKKTHCVSGLLGFWTLSIIQYSEEH